MDVGIEKEMQGDEDEDDASAPPRRPDRDVEEE
jgi:hypothetical protein